MRASLPPNPNRPPNLPWRHSFLGPIKRRLHIRRPVLHLSPPMLSLRSPADQHAPFLILDPGRGDCTARRAHLVNDGGHLWIRRPVLIFARHGTSLPPGYAGTHRGLCGVGSGSRSIDTRARRSLSSRGSGRRGTRDSCSLAFGNAEACAGRRQGVLAVYADPRSDGSGRGSFPLPKPLINTKSVTFRLLGNYLYASFSPSVRIYSATYLHRHSYN